MQSTGFIFATTYYGRAVALPLMRTETGDIVPEGYAERDAEVVRRWMDFRLAEQLRREGVPLVDLDLLTAGTVVPDQPAYHLREV